MQEQNHNHRARPVGMKATEKRSGRYRLGDISDRRVSVIGGWNVVQRKKYSGNHLRNENEEQTGAKYVGETRSARDGLIEGASQQVIHAGAAVQPSPWT